MFWILLMRRPARERNRRPHGANPGGRADERRYPLLPRRQLRGDPHGPVRRADSERFYVFVYGLMVAVGLRLIWEGLSEIL